MKNEIEGTRESHIVPRILVAVVIILSSMGLYSIMLDLWRGEVVSPLERLFATVLILIIMGTIAYVIIQRLQMRKTEKFRREKW